MDPRPHSSKTLMRILPTSAEDLVSETPPLIATSLPRTAYNNDNKRIVTGQLLLTPELVQRKLLQPPGLKPSPSAYTSSNRLFTPIRLQHQLESSPSASTDWGQHTYFSRVSEHASSCSISSASSSPPVILQQKAFFAGRSASSPSSLYLSPETTPSKSERTSPAATSIFLAPESSSLHLPYCFRAAALATTTVAPPPQPLFLTTPPRPVHLLEQQQEQLLLQREQELLQLQLQPQDFHQQQQEQEILERHLQQEFQQYYCDRQQQQQQQALSEDQKLAQLQYGRQQEQPQQQIMLKQSIDQQQQQQQQALSEEQELVQLQNEQQQPQQKVLLKLSIEQEQQQHGFQQQQHEQAMMKQPTINEHFRQILQHENYQAFWNAHHTLTGQPLENVQTELLSITPEQQNQQQQQELYDLPTRQLRPRLYCYEPQPQGDFPFAVASQDPQLPVSHPAVKPGLLPTQDHPLCSSLSDADAPRVLNPTTTHANDEQRSLEPIPNRSKISNDREAEETNGNWSGGVSATVHRAVGKLKNLATHMAKSADESSTPDAVNTSTETSRSSNDQDASSEMCSSGFDLKELEDELRGRTSEGARGDEEREFPPIIKNGPHRVDALRSAVSVDTVEAPKLAALARGDVVPFAQHLQKPGPLFESLKSLASALPRRQPLGQTTTTTQEIIRQEKGPDTRLAVVRASIHANSPASLFSNVVATAVPPIMRMRKQEAKTIPGSQRVIETAKEVKNSLCDENFKIMKQKRCKDKIQIVRKKLREDENLTTNRNFDDKRVSVRKPRPRRKKLKPKSKARKSRNDDSSANSGGARKFSFPDGAPAWTDVAEMLDMFLRNRCGNLDNACFVDDDSVDGSEVESDDDETVSDASESSAGRTRVPSVTGMLSAVTNSTIGQSITTVEETEPIAPRKSDGARNIGINDKQFIRDFTSRATKEGLLLMLHNKNPEKAFSQPTKIIAYIQRGAHGELGCFIGPKLVWKAVNGDKIGEADLLDVKSLEKVTAQQLQKYPFAMPGRSLFLRMNRGKDYVFEAQNEDEALRFVHGMRWVIARLAFNLIIGNLSVSCELLDVKAESAGNRNGKFPSTLKGVADWTMAMNDVTSHLVDIASMPLP